MTARSGNRHSFRWRMMPGLGVVSLALVPLLGAGCASSAEVGGRAPDFRLTSLDGKSVELSNFRGKPVVLAFWAYG